MPWLRSIRGRLAAAAALSIALALPVAGIGLLALFEGQVEARIGAELTAQLNQLAAAVRIGPDGSPLIDPSPADPRFDTPLSGLYWQIDDDALQSQGPRGEPGSLRSRSLWDSSIQLPPDSLETGAVHAHRLPGPGDQQLLVRERRLILDTPGGGRALRLMVAIDQRELASARQAFAAGMLPYLGLMAAVLGGAIWLQLRIGLAPLESIRQGVGAIRSGSARRLPDDYPAEVMPLVQEVNALLAAREQAIERARGWTADLAHGLKTPLAALSADAGRLRAAGNEQAATDIEQLAADMRRRVDRELMRARLRAGAVDVGSGADLARAISKLLRTLQRTPDGEHLGWRVDIHSPRQVAVPEGDLLELLGNLLENAARFARTIVWIDELPSREDRVRLRIADDGPGVSAADLSRLGERGVRLDQAKGGSGLGLAIARDIVDAYGGALDLGIAAEGGLAVTIELPRPALGQR